jgi:hypothetical protein
MSRNPPNLGVDLRIIQLYGEGTNGTTWPWIHPHSHFSLMESLNVVADKGPKEIRSHQPSLQQPLDNLMQGL